jgi:hypothetical protein
MFAWLSIIMKFLQALIGVFKKLFLDNNPDAAKAGLTANKAASNLFRVWAMSRLLFINAASTSSAIANSPDGEFPLAWLDKGIMSFNRNMFAKPRNLAEMRKNERAQQALQYCYRGKTVYPHGEGAEEKQNRDFYASNLDGYRKNERGETGLRVISLVAPFTVFPNLQMKVLTNEDFQRAFGWAKTNKAYNSTSKDFSSAYVTEWWICQMLVCSFGWAPQFEGNMPPPALEFFNLGGYESHCKPFYGARPDKTVGQQLERTFLIWQFLKKKFRV